ncbi:MAG: hypothetical protein N3A38_09685, partial [Planctomycetota bacterium]|nr:hypothetical protein [Planctomycetota bacterium]
MKEDRDLKSGRRQAVEAGGGAPAGERVAVYDTTLRDGAQSEHVSFSLEDKLDIARCLDEIGVDFIEGGWPGSNPKDLEFFEVVRKMRFVNARIAAFGSTRHAGLAPDKDENLRLLARSGAPALTIFGKSWDLHVRGALRTTLQENLEMIRSSLKFLRPHCEVLIYDA